LVVRLRGIEPLDSPPYIPGVNARGFTALPDKSIQIFESQEMEVMVAPKQLSLFD
jgi:hypothetical protein